MIPDLLADPFGERSHTIARRRLHLLGGRIVFESANPELLRLVDAAYADLPRHRLSARTPELRVGLVLTSSSSQRGHRRAEPPPLQMLSAIGFAAARRLRPASWWYLPAQVRQSCRCRGRCSDFPITHATN